MALGVEEAVMGWDLSLRAQSKRVFAMNSIWLREDREGATGGSIFGERNLEYRPWGMRNKLGYGATIDPILGINLKGNMFSSSQRLKHLLAKQAYSSMEHDFKEGVLIGKEGKKKT
ncbi:hypothetical protein J1N35_004951 [Gossypium stocksii]|uniref:Uncharacterized protein n=1 Tax=Gossypium stocksii TaxID=47602 RepID=A0A9D4AIT2_9ROSI|nr:hypothetical protein J1N35_004951 [Gossypium stocksii]